MGTHTPRSRVGQPSILAWAQPGLTVVTQPPSCKGKDCFSCSSPSSFCETALSFFLFFFFGGTGSLFQKDIYQFSVSKQLHYCFFFFLPVGPQRRPHQRREHFKPIKLQDAHLTDLTETSSKKGDWVGKETLKDQHTAGPQTVESSHRQRGDQCASTPKKQRSKI